MSKFLRRCSVVLALTGATTALTVSEATAEPPITETTHEKNATETFIDVLPTCDEGGPLYEITITYNSVEHTTESATMIHATFTQTGTFVATPFDDPSLPDASGKFTLWGGFNANPGGAVNGTFTFNIRGTFEDGTKFTNHVTDHFNDTPNGASFFFTHCHD